jgi:hypothetical protein
MYVYGCHQKSSLADVTSANRETAFVHDICLVRDCFMILNVRAPIKMKYPIEANTLTCFTSNFPEKLFTIAFNRKLFLFTP